MSDALLTPEELVCQMSDRELMELLADIEMESTPAMAVRIKKMIRNLGTFEAAIEAVGGYPAMRKAA